MKRIITIILTALFSLIYTINSSYAVNSSRSIQSILPEFSQKAEEAMIELHVPGMAIAIVKDDKVIYSKGFGVRQVNTNLKVTPETVFQVASVSKPMTTTVLAMLIDKKTKITFDSKIEDLDPDFELSNPYISAHLTLADLLSHRSGLPDHSGDILEDLGYSKSEIIYRLRYIKQLDKFRLSNNYTNFGFSEAAYATARSLGTTWDSLFRQYLIVPLNMKSTSTTFEDYENTDNRAIGHMLIDGKAIALDNNSKNSMLPKPRNPDAQAPAGGVSSNIIDMSQWLILQINEGKYQNKQLVDKNALKITHTPQNIKGTINKDSWSFYGLGWNISKDINGVVKISHSGAFALGTRSEVAYLPKQKVGIIVLSNAAITGLPEVVSQTFFDLLKNGKVTQDWVKIINDFVVNSMAYSNELSEKPKTVYPSLPLISYEGDYYNDYFGKIKIVKENDQLIAIIGPKHIQFPLTHWNRDTFYLNTIGENATGPTLVEFSIGSNDKANHVIISAFNKFGTGEFEAIK
ncbi:serine hydrolase [Thiotrichales bacterium 19S3-7]|nr:serine hydrolase [Thiotrichales bacterium 19S3-7]MCF6801533.1 serine hydrolase [Thiotrichales bacterium 19S3-11]